MPQSNVLLYTSRQKKTVQTPGGTSTGDFFVPMQLDASGNLLIGSGMSSALGVTTPTIIKAAPGRICKVSVIQQASSGTFGVYDSTSVTGNSVANALLQFVADCPTEGTFFTIDAPCANGIVVDPGVDGMVAVSFS